MWTKAMALTIVGCLLGLSCRTVPLGGRWFLPRKDLPVSLTQARLRLAYNLRRGTFRVTRLRNSIRLSKMATAVTLGNRTFVSTDESCVNRVTRRDVLRLVIESAVADGPTWETCFEIRIHPNVGDPTLDRLLRESYGVAVTCRLVNDSARETSPRFSLIGEALAKRAAFACRLADMTTLKSAQAITGDVVSSPNTSFCDPENDCAVHFEAQRVAIGPPQHRGRGKAFPIRLDFSATAGLDFAERLSEVMAQWQTPDLGGIARSAAE
ncbi:hypothetical protein AMJ85_10850 [candidate division BRC1 bacterium SM23_51]|nr:MAG: hypothetical protein AMJ85_10850 [candidate division BRC1 bacterium SM23_51]